MLTQVGSLLLPNQEQQYGTGGGTHPACPPLVLYPASDDRHSPLSSIAGGQFSTPTPNVTLLHKHFLHPSN